jgi:signal transduction histidine kinase
MAARHPRLQRPAKSPHAGPLRPIRGRDLNFLAPPVADRDRLSGSGSWYSCGMLLTKFKLPRLAQSLSAKLLILTIAFVMLAEVLIYAPSIGLYRLTYLQDRLADAHLAILALEATPDNMVGEELERELLAHVGATMVALKKPNAGKLVLMTEKPQRIDASFDLRDSNFFGLIGSAFMTLMHDGNRILRVVGSSPKDSQILVEIVLPETELRARMIGYSNRILALSFVISLFTAALVYLSLHLLMVRPLSRLTRNMARFREAPEDASRIAQPTARNDEIGVARRELANMQHGLRDALLQRAHLAALGTAVTKINHDLRNILATASLVSDRLSGSGDPEVQRVAPTLVSAIDRAVNLCTQTLDFTRHGAHRIDPKSFDLGTLVSQVRETLPEQINGTPVLHPNFGAPFEVKGDQEQLFRVLSNLSLNAIGAGATRIEIDARREDRAVVIDVIDNGPGLPPRARENLFQPFAASTRPGGTGLGLAIARELMRAHGGDLELMRSTGQGTCFRMTIPAAPEP